ncbi:MAG: FCD domain-containing protein [Flavobacteriales bacterium]|nr:MAG: FCD domain-containing protein [Flavobacteriales bacterium]
MTNNPYPALADRAWSHLAATCRFVIVLLTLAMSTAVPTANAAGVHDHDHPRVLVVHSYHEGLPWTDAVQRGFRESLGEQAEHLNLYFEYLDALRTAGTGPRAEEAFVQRVVERYRPLDLDILVATDDPAYNLLRAIRDRLAPGKPILFAGVNNIREENLIGVEGVAGIAETPDFTATLALMQRLHPDRKKLYVIGDTTRTFASNLAALETANATLPAPFDMTIVARQKLDDVRAQMANIPGDALIFLMGRPQDDRGNLVTGPEVARLLSGTTTQPIYTGWDFFLGHGVVGGMMVSAGEQGRVLAELLTRLARGEPLTRLPRLTPSPNRFAFDHVQLQRFNIAPGALPGGSLIVNRPPQVWEAYPKTFVSIVAIFILLLALLGFLAFHMKVKRRAAAEVERELTLMQAMMDAAPYPMFFKDTALIYQRVNDAFLDFLGKTRETVVGASLNAVADDQHAEIYRNRDLELLSGNGQQIYEAQVVAADGSIRDVIFHKAVVQGANGSAEGIVGAMLDVTHMRRIEADLRTLNQNLETRVTERTGELARANTELERTIDSLSLAQDELTRQERLSSLGSMVAGVAHELNTPIGNSLTVATTLQDAVSNLTQEVASGTLRRSTLNDFSTRCMDASDMLVRNLERAARLISNFKEVAVDQTSDRRRRFALADCIDEIVQTFEAGAPGAHPRIAVDIPPGIALESYPGALGQILLNLLENARCHAFSGIPMGEVRIAATMVNEESVRISIGDNGRGIPASDLTRIFDPFFTTRLGQGGSGLGLSIVYRLATQTLGGRIRVSSDSGRGTMFVLDLPLKAPMQEHDTPDVCEAQADMADAPPASTRAAEMPLYKRDDLLDIRELVEANAAGLAASNALDGDRRRIRQAFDALDAAFVTDDLESQIERDLAFHMSIIEATHDPALRKVGDAIIQLMYGHIRRNLSGLTPNPDRRNALRQQHRILFDAIMTRDAAAASAAAADHMRYVREQGKLPLIGEATA